MSQMVVTRDLKKPTTQLQTAALWLGHAFAITALILVCTWACSNTDDDYFLGGVSWSGDNIFNWHPIFMVSGMVVAYTWGILAYRTLPLGKEKNKIMHGASMAAACVLISLGLYTVFRYHNDNLFGNLISMHSWMGIATVTLFFANFVGGEAAFFLKIVPEEIRKAYLPRHSFLGIFTYFSACFTCLSGIMEKNNFLGCDYDITLTEADTNPASHYSNIYAGCRLSNGLGIVIICTCMCAAFAVLDMDHDHPKEKGGGGEEPLLQGQAQGQAQVQVQQGT